MSGNKIENKGSLQLIGILGSAVSALSVIHPGFGIAASLIKAMQKGVDDENICTELKSEFKSINQTLDELSKQHHKTLLEIKKNTLDAQYSEVVSMLHRHFEMYEGIMQADPARREEMKNEFKEKYSREMGEKHLNTLYDGVTKNDMTFSRPVLEVYLEYAEGTSCARCTMEGLCKHLNYLFTIGLIAYMGYAAIKGYDQESRKETWAKKMSEVQKKMQEALAKCK
ncbi:protein rapunzel-like [Myripristis murdjan]|uniref:protein rapunzel-like n=1 Tax=Myripristis murdjan TaxID=586833 RepID=UPI001175CFE9|nr:protein rapunzel-like [Myripristis murdjan]XP_029929313.1 protein rapunzel-like [Myripristis murdjan]XP_029929314.1 protein rapunzel-like [Myripristis murdjan]